jgi:hypothetical protein
MEARLGREPKGKAMSQEQNQAEILRSLVNSGRFRLPLCHSHALEIVALLNGAKDWNAMAAGKGAAAGKARAKALRAYLATEAAVPLTAEAASLALAAPPVVQTEKPVTAPAIQAASLLPAAIAFKRERFGKHEWRIENGNRLVGDTLDELLERGEGAPRFMERKAEPLLRRHPGDLELINSAAVAKLQLGKSAEAAALWRQGWEWVAEPVERMLSADPQAKVSYSSLENRPFYRVLHGHVTSLNALKSEAELEQVVRLSGLAFQLSRDRDGIGFRMLHVGYLGDGRKWEDLVRFVDRMDEGNAGCFEVMLFRAAAAALLGHTDAEERFQELIRHNPFAVEVLGNGIPVPGWGDGNEPGITMGSWQEGAEVLLHHAEMWQAPQLREILNRLRPRLLEAQVARVKETQRAQAHFNDPGRTREYVEGFRTPRYARIVPLLESEWAGLWPDLAPLGRRKR